MSRTSTYLSVLVAVFLAGALPLTGAESLRVGTAETEITPPQGFPMAGYYHERLADGMIDPLKAKAIVFRDANASAAIVVCDLIGISADLCAAVRQRASEKTGINSAHITVSATHSHTAPDYSLELFRFIGGKSTNDPRGQYPEKLVQGIADAIIRADANAQAVAIHVGSAQQTTPVSFNRRFVMRDGSVRTWMNLENPDVVRAAGPIDSEIALATFHSAEAAKPHTVLSNFALHLDTVGGMRWSADYPYYIEKSVRAALGENALSVFGTGCCGDINHVDPSRRERNKTEFIGSALGATITSQLDKLAPLKRHSLQVRSQTIQLPLQEVTAQQIERSMRIIDLARRSEKVDFFDHVTAYKSIILEQFRNPKPAITVADHITWGLSHRLAGVGAYLPVDLQTICIGDELAIVCLPGEVFVDLGLAIKRGSPFKTTMVIELSNYVETIYIPTRAAYAGGSYEVTNSALQPGAGEILVEQALKMLRECATDSKSR